MCLLITSTSAKMRAVLLNTPGLIEDIYAKNSDGLGAMYATTDGLKVVKKLPKTPQEVRKFVEKLPNDDRELALHFRWRTHGDINLAQCHPYPVSEGTALMHNGILDTGNKADPTKSDTWHFIEDYLKKMTTDGLHDPKVTDMIGDYIGPNKFAIMSADGRLTVINKDQGVAFEGVWYSNTYAWEPSLVIPTYRSKPTYSSRSIDEWRNAWATEDYRAKWSDEVEDEEDGTYVQDALEAAMENQDSDELEALLVDYPLDTLQCVFNTYRVTPYSGADDTDLTAPVVAVRDALLGGDVLTLMELLEDDLHGAVPDRIAQTLMWYCNVKFKISAFNRPKELA